MWDGLDVGISKDRERRRVLARFPRALILFTALGAKSAPAALIGLGGRGLEGGLATVSNAAGGLRVWYCAALGSWIGGAADPSSRGSVSDSVTLFAIRLTMSSPERSTLAAAPKSPDASA